MVGGYLLIHSLKRQLERGEFNYWRFLLRKIVRLWPLVILVTLLAVVIGYALMLPDDYENLVESAIASSMFANNILQSITTGNYWDVVNLYKPLMHLWYVGLLMQAYVILPLVYMLLYKMIPKRGMTIGTVGMTIVSLVLFLLPTFPSTWKFYYLPFRAFEITAGGLLAELEPKERHCKGKITTIWISMVLLIALLCSRRVIVSSSLMLLLTIAFSLSFLWASKELSCNGLTEKLLEIGAAIGKRSYSIYIWHQVIVAFLFYSFFPKHNAYSLLAFIGITILVAVFSYRYIEVPLEKTVGKKRKEAAVILCTIITTVVLCGSSYYIYRNAGVVRDVPELDVYKENVHRGMHAEYCDRPYVWDRDFEDNDKLKVLVLGNSFGRDWANILFEWNVEENLSISYLYYTEDAVEGHVRRIADADIVFYVVGPSYYEVPEIIKNTVQRNKLFVVGNKNYGESNGIIYAHRLSADYFEQTFEIPVELVSANSRDMSHYSDHYIDMMSPVMVDETHARVFTDDKKFISQDCRHLTQAGAQYYARILDIGEILGIE